MNINSNLIKLLISILIIILIYNCINLTKSKSKSISIEGFETMTNDDIELYKKEVKKLENRVKNENIVGKIKEKIKRNNIYEDENIRLYVNYKVKKNYIDLFADGGKKIEDLKNDINKEEHLSLMFWIILTVMIFIKKIEIDVLLPIKDINEDKLLYKKIVNELSNEIGLNKDDKKTDNEKMEEMDKINKKTEEKLDQSKNINVLKLFVDADISNSKINENVNICLDNMNDLNKSIKLDEYIYLLERNPIMKEFIKKLLKNGEKTTENINKSAYPTNKTINEIKEINKKKRQEFNKKWKEYTSKKTKVKPKRSKELDHLTAEFVENKDLEIFDEKKSFNNIVRLLYFKKIFNRVKNLDNDYKKIIDEKLTTNQMSSNNKDNEGESSGFSFF